MFTANINKFKRQTNTTRRALIQTAFVWNVDYPWIILIDRGAPVVDIYQRIMLTYRQVTREEFYASRFIGFPNLTNLCWQSFSLGSATNITPLTVTVHQYSAAKQLKLRRRSVLPLNFPCSDESSYLHHKNTMSGER